MRVGHIRLSILVLATTLSACGASTQVPEPGAVLLRLTLAPGAPTPEELRLFVYDDSGPLWSDARFPDQGKLVPESASRLGTILIQPGASTGALRLEVRGLDGGGQRVVGGVLAIAPAARAKGTFDLALDATVPPDGDGDGIPDAIDDCPAVTNPAQRGCTDGGSPDAGGPDGAAPDTGPPGGDGSACDVGGGCNRPLGAACPAPEGCASGFCVDGVCCANACLGPCRSCNQPGADGVCKGYAAMTDPDFECTTAGMACNGAGACGPASAPGNKARGELCAAGSECASTFCKEGVCCNTACTNPCETCASGTCSPVRRTMDVPECVAPMTCNAQARCIVM